MLGFLWLKPNQDQHCNLLGHLFGRGERKSSCGCSSTFYLYSIVIKPEAKDKNFADGTGSFISMFLKVHDFVHCQSCFPVNYMRFMAFAKGLLEWSGQHISLKAGNDCNWSIFSCIWHLREEAWVIYIIPYLWGISRCPSIRCRQCSIYLV